MPEIPEIPGLGSLDSVRVLAWAEIHGSPDLVCLAGFRLSVAQAQVNDGETRLFSGVLGNPAMSFKRPPLAAASGDA